jgi:hypothetical protein
LIYSKHKRSGKDEETFLLLIEEAKKKSFFGKKRGVKGTTSTKLCFSRLAKFLLQT